MIKKIFIILIISLIFNVHSNAAGTSSESDNKSDYDKAVTLIKSAKTFEKLLIKSNNEKPLQADTLNYLGFSTRKLGDFENGEKYYLLGLEIDPTHIGINEYLGELYVATQRIDLAKERLEVLKNCNCEEFQELKEIIDGTKTTK